VVEQGREAQASVEVGAQIIHTSRFELHQAKSGLDIGPGRPGHGAALYPALAPVDAGEAGRQVAVYWGAAQDKEIEIGPAVAQLHTVEVAADLVTPSRAAYFGDDAGQLKGVQEQAIAKDRVEVAGGGRKGSAAVVDVALDDFSVVATGLGGGEILAAQTGLEAGGGIVEVDLRISCAQLGRILVGDVADLDFAEGAEAYLAKSGMGECQR
jgi:hypothetical protein